MILYDSAGEIVDEVSYQDIASSKSLERKAFYNNQCVSAQNDGEFFGNGCDTDSANDFEIRDIPNPQNYFSLPEPRSAPTAPEDFKIQYSSSTKELALVWQPSGDYNGATSTVVYKIIDVSQASSTLLTIETASATAKISINERGRSYIFLSRLLIKRVWVLKKAKRKLTSLPSSKLF